MRKVDDRFVAPKALVERTKQDLAFLKENPRPPSAMPRKGAAGRAPAADNGDDDDYSDDNYDENDFADDDDEGAKALDGKLDQLRKAMHREATKAERLVQKTGIDLQAKKNDGKPVLKLGPSKAPAMDMAAYRRGVMP